MVPCVIAQVAPLAEGLEVFAGAVFRLVVKVGDGQDDAHGFGIINRVRRGVGHLGSRVCAKAVFVGRPADRPPDRRAVAGKAAQDGLRIWGLAPFAAVARLGPDRCADRFPVCRIAGLFGFADGHYAHPRFCSAVWSVSTWP